jgi:hypothetical protein
MTSAFLAHRLRSGRLAVAGIPIKPRRNTMELFGIIFSIPAALVASVTYIALLKWIIGRLPQLTTPMLAGSGAVLALFVVEIVLLVIMGAARGRGVVGSAFYGLHLVIFILGMPALANVLVLRGRVTTPLAVTLCTVFAFILVLMQYGVTEALYGIDGSDGPYSK